MYEAIIHCGMRWTKVRIRGQKRLIPLQSRMAQQHHHALLQRQNSAQQSIVMAFPKNLMVFIRIAWVFFRWRLEPMNFRIFNGLNVHL